MSIVKVNCNEKRHSLLRFMAKKMGYSVSRLCGEMIEAGIEQQIDCDWLLEYSQEFYNRNRLNQLSERQQIAEAEEFVRGVKIENVKKRLYRALELDSYYMALVCLEELHAL